MRHSCLGGLLPHTLLWWLLTVGFALLVASAGLPARAAIPATAAQHLPAGAAPIESSETARLRIAQASGPLEAFFSIFKPKPKREVNRLPAGQVAPKARGLDARLPPMGNASLGSDEPPAILVQPRTRPRLGAGYRTMCVRLCDGYYWPASTGPANIARDRNTCEQSCQSETKLYILPSLGADAAAMRDLSGKPYETLKTAFLYRESYLPECRCRPDPWSATEEMRHEDYRAAASGEWLDATPGSSDGTDADDLTLGPIAPGEDAISDIELATGEGSDESEHRLIGPAAPSATRAKAVSLPHLPALPRKPGAAKSTAKVTPVPSVGKAGSAPTKKLQSSIGRTIR